MRSLSGRRTADTIYKRELRAGMGAGMKYKRYFFLKMLVNYLLIILLPFCVLTYAYSDGRKNARANAQENQMTKLMLVVKENGQTVKKLKELAYQLSIHYQIKQFAGKPGPASYNTSAADSYMLKELLRPYLVTSDSIDELMLAYRYSDMLITNTGSILNLEGLYRENYAESFSDYEEWYDWLFRDGENGFTQRKIKSDSEQLKECLIYKLTANNLYDDHIVNIFLTLDMERFFQAFLSLPAESGGEAYVVGDSIRFSSGQTDPLFFYQSVEARITESEGEFYTEFEGKKLLVTYIRDARLGGTYLLAAPEEWILNQISSLRKLFNILTVFSILSALALVILSSIKSAEPWIKLFITLGDNEGENKGRKNFQSYINQKVTEIVRRNRGLSRQLEELRPAVRNAVMSKIISGDYAQEEELTRDIRQTGIETNHLFYAVVLITFIDIDIDQDMDGMFSELSIYKVLAEQYLNDQFAGLQGTCQTDIGTMAVILTSDKENYVEFLMQIEEGISKVMVRCREEWQINLAFSGSITDSIMKLPKCFREAKTAQNYELRVNNLVISWYKKGRNITLNDIYYPIQLEQQIILCVEEGNRNGLNQCIGELTSFNFKKEQRTEEAYLQLFQMLQGTIARSVSGNPDLAKRIEKSILKWREEFRTSKNIESLYHGLCDILMDLCSHEAEKIDQSLYGKILAYIQRNFMDNQLSLSRAADEFHITDIYLSKYFKEKNGMNFSKYVEEQRLTAASGLLESTRHSIQTIAEMVGYNSPQVFRRAYKKRYGKTPREK